MQDKTQTSDELKTGDSPYASPEAEMGGGSTFSLASLMAIVVLCAIGFGIMYYTVGLGVAFFIIAALAFFRVKLHRRTAWVCGFERTGLAVMLVILLTPICCGVAFFTNCLAGVFAAEQLNMTSPAQAATTVALAFGLGGVTALQTGELIVALLFGKRPKGINP